VLRNEDQSPSSRNRPQFDSARQRILAGEADAIIVWKTSRLARARPQAEDVWPLLAGEEDLLREQGFDMGLDGSPAAVADSLRVRSIGRVSPPGTVGRRYRAWLHSRPSPGRSRISRMCRGGSTSSTTDRTPSRTPEPTPELLGATLARTGDLPPKNSRSESSVRRELSHLSPQHGPLPPSTLINRALSPPRAPRPCRRRAASQARRRTSQQTTATCRERHDAYRMLGARFVRLETGRPNWGAPDVAGVRARAGQRGRRSRGHATRRPMGNRHD